MVDYTALSNSRPELWEFAADDILAVAKQATRTADNIHADGVGPLAEHWRDETGEIARKTLVSCADRMVDTGILARGVALALDTLEDAVRIARSSLNSAVSYAESYGLVVDHNGRVTTTTNSDALDPELVRRVMDETQMQIDDAIEAATQADSQCVAAITSCSVNPDVVTTDDARNRQASASAAALKEIRNLVPDGLPQETVAKW